MDVKEYCNGDYLIICSCEGTAEEDTINWLLDEDKLLFSREDLIYKKITRLRTAKKIENEFLNLDYDKPVVIFRVLDSTKEVFQLGKLYKDRFDVCDYITNPEIEILMVIDAGDLDSYTKKFSRFKPSDYLSNTYKIKGIKKSGMIREFFNGDIERLILSIREHKSKKGKKHLTLFDLLKD